MLAFFFCLNQLTFEVEDLDKEGSRGKGRVVAGRVAQTRPLLPSDGQRAGAPPSGAQERRALLVACASCGLPERRLAEPRDCGRGVLAAEPDARHTVENAALRLAWAA